MHSGVCRNEAGNELVALDSDSFGLSDGHCLDSGFLDISSRKTVRIVRVIGGGIVIDWIIGGVIAGLTLFIIIRSFMRFKKGEAVCGCQCDGKTKCGDKG